MDQTIQDIKGRIAKKAPYVVAKGYQWDQPMAQYAGVFFEVEHDEDLFAPPFVQEETAPEVDLMASLQEIQAAQGLPITEDGVVITHAQVVQAMGYPAKDDVIYEWHPPSNTISLP